MPPPDPADVAFFEKRVRPVLVEQCVSCHGPELQLGKVRLDTAEGIRAVLTPGDPANSRLLRAMHYDGAVKMPPSGKRPDAEIAALTEWIKRGADYPAPGAPANNRIGWNAPSRTGYWSFRPVKMPRVPVVPKAATPIDAFLEAKRREKQLPAATRVDKRTLLRRASFDLVGLPPTPAEVDAFLADRSPDAYAKVIDRLLASPHFGERWGRHWLDVARYADSNGLDENTAFGNAYRYRDWVIAAMNDDKPYDAFIQEQIAGDLLDSGTNEKLRNDRLTATGFLTLGAKVLAEPDKEKMVMDIVDEQIDVTTKSVLGLTVACARCHDHKFDPISTRDYYALAGIFKSTKTMATLNTVAKINQRPLRTTALTESMATHTRQVTEQEKAVADTRAAAVIALRNGLRSDEPKYLKAGWELARRPGTVVSLAETPEQPGDPKRISIEAVNYMRGNANRDSSTYGNKEVPVLNTAKLPFVAEWDIPVSEAGKYLLEIRYAAEEARPMKLIVNDIVVSDNIAGSVTGGWKPDAQRWEPQMIVALAAGVNRVRLERGGAAPHLHRLMLMPAPPGSETGSWAATKQAADEIGKREKILPELVLRYAARAFHAPTPEAAVRRSPAESVLAGTLEKPEPYFAGATADAYKKATDALKTLRENAPTYPIAMAVEDAKPEDVRVHIRGNTQTLGDIAPRGFPVVMAKYKAAPITPQESGRKELAMWLTRPENPLTARVAVNRVWQHLFGAGLVRTPDNWGLRGEAPTHPELLDYLAATFVGQDGWSQKKLIRRLMLTDAYQMTSIVRDSEAAFRKDPENRLLWRANRRRLEAEPFRDAMLFVSGQLDPRMGGTLLTTPDAEYVTNDQSKDQALYAAKRRSIYLPVIRNSLYDLFQSFDFGDGTTVNAWRADTTVSPQALYALNSPLVRDAATRFAASLPAKTGDAKPVTDAVRIQTAYRRAYGRWASKEEVRRVKEYLDKYVALSAALEPDPEARRKKAWASFCQTILASNEFLYAN
jgi:cytochrome c553